MLRHTFVTGLVRAGNDLVLIAELAGHRRLETTRRYSLCRRRYSLCRRRYSLCRRRLTAGRLSLTWRSSSDACRDPQRQSAP